MDQPPSDQLNRALEAITAAIEKQNSSHREPERAAATLAIPFEHGRHLQTSCTTDAHHELSSGKKGGPWKREWWTTTTMRGNDSQDSDGDEALVRRVKRVFHKLIDRWSR